MVGPISGVVGVIYMLMFILRRIVTMVVSAFCITMVVFYLTNLQPNLEKIAKSEAGSRISDAIPGSASVQSFL